MSQLLLLRVIKINPTSVEQSNIKPTAKQEVEQNIGDEKTFLQDDINVDVTACAEKQVPSYTAKHTAALNHRDNHLASTNSIRLITSEHMRRVERDRNEIPF